MARGHYDITPGGLSTTLTRLKLSDGIRGELLEINALWIEEPRPNILIEIASYMMYYPGGEMVMNNRQPLFEKLETRRRELGISQAGLAHRCGVSLPTVHRILSGQSSAANVENILAIAQFLGMELEAVPRLDAETILEQQARRKAEKLVRMVQGSSALESQGISSRHIGQMIKKTVQELLAGSRRRLWAE